MQRQRVNVYSVYEQLAKLKYSGDTGPDPGQDEDEDGAGARGLHVRHNQPYKLLLSQTTNKPK